MARASSMGEELVIVKIVGHTAGMAQRYHHGDLRRQLLAQAGELLESDGPEAITLRGLARRLGVSHAAPSHHFHDREALLVELAAQGHEMLEAAMRRRLADEPQQPPSLAIGEGYLDFALANPNRFRLMFAGIAEMEPTGSPSFTDAAQRSFATLVQFTGDDSDPDHTEPWLSSWALVHGLATLWVDGSLHYAFGTPGDPAPFRSRATRILAEHTRAMGVEPGAVGRPVELDGLAGGDF